MNATVKAVAEDKREALGAVYAVFKMSSPLQGAARVARRAPDPDKAWADLEKTIVDAMASGRCAGLYSSVLERCLGEEDDEKRWFMILEYALAAAGMPAPSEDELVSDIVFVLVCRAELLL